MDRRSYNKYGQPTIPVSSSLVEDEKLLQKFDSFLLTDEQRLVVESTIKEVCRNREYDLYASNVRTNHVHSVVQALRPPEKIVEAFKSYSTRNLRNAKLISSDDKVWSRHASTRYLWKESSVNRAVEYVLYGQGDEFPNFDESVG